jgi:hypothetical protein
MRYMAKRLTKPRMWVRSDAECPLRHAPCLPEPERLVGLGFRYWMLGRTTGDVNCWVRAWNLYSGIFGVPGARVAVSHLSSWVAAVGSATHREIEVFPQECAGFCRDECLAVSMIAACQHHTCPAMRACAFALAESSLIDSVVQEAQGFADAMMSLDQVLSARSIVPATADIVPATGVMQ